MHSGTATAISCPNIALIKYWGNRDPILRLPSTGSISMTLGGLYTRTQVSFTPGLEQDSLALNGQITYGTALQRVSELLDRVRRRSGVGLFAQVVSENNFPAGTGIASSASAFAALALAASHAAGLDLSEGELSRLARTASGSACRSIPGGFVEWQAGEDDESSFAYSIAPAEHWPLADCVALVSQAHKETGSYEGHASADNSIYQPARIADAPRRLELCRQAVLQRDFQALAEIVELDSNLMHAVMQTSAPPLLYWLPPTLAVMQAVLSWRKSGLPVCYTIDAGPNVHVICLKEDTAQVVERLRQIPGVRNVLKASCGGPARLVGE
jgi:diphosphomevalonate decarboxylase